MKNSIPVTKYYVLEEVDKNRLEDYQKTAWRFAIPESGSDYFYYALLEEKGEVLGVIAKSIRSRTPVDTNRLMDELGDLLWQIAAISTSNYITLRHSNEHSSILDVSAIDRLAAAYKSKMVSKRRVYYAVDFIRTMASMFGLSFGDIMDKNIQKLEERKQKNTIGLVDRKEGER